jgi:uncharacterized membrane protein
MVSRDTRETALFVVIAVVGGLVSLAVNAPDVVTAAIFFGFGVLGPTARDEWRRRQDASP